jgi:hypothetical protein
VGVVSSQAGAQSGATRFSSLIRKITGSAVLWSWGMNGIRLGFGLLVLPLLIVLLPKRDLGFYQLLMSLVAVVPLLDVGLSSAIERGLGYAMGGASELQAHGVQAAPSGDGRPNQALLWRIIHAAKVYYSVMAVLGLVLMGAIGVWVVARNAGQTSNPTLCWVSLGIAVANAGFEIYAGWWSAVLRGINGVPASARIVFFAHSVKLILSCALLLLGGGMVSVFAAGFVSSWMIRFYSRRAALALLPREPDKVSGRSEIVALLRVLWPNSWRVGLQVLSGFVTTLLLALLCTEMMEDKLGAYQAYGLSLQVVGILQGIAAVWVNVKWPLVSQLRGRQDYGGLRSVLWPRFWLQAVTFLVTAAVVAGCGPYLLRLISADKQLLPHPWLMLMLLQGFMDLQVSFWTFLLATENRVPSLWPMLITYAVTLSLVLVLNGTTSLGIGVFALAPFLANLAFNYWYWPIVGPRNLRTGWFRFAFARGT